MSRTQSVLSQTNKTVSTQVTELAKTTTESFREVVRALFSRRSRFLLHGSVLALSMFVAGMNVYAKTNDEVVRAERNILAQLIFPDQDRYEVVTADAGRSSTPDSYVPSSISVASAASAEGALTDDSYLLDAVETDPYAVPSIGGDTLVKASPSDTDESYKPRTNALKHTVQPGESVSQIAAAYGIDAATILQENKKYANDIVKAGEELTILPFVGATERVDEGETLSGIAEKHGVSLETLLEDNDMYSEDDVEVAQILLVRDGKRGDYVGARPVPQVVAATSSGSGSSAGSGVTSSVTGTHGGVTPPTTVTPGSRVGNRFPWGWCTWYVAEVRGDVTWRGNAGQWLANARAQGKPTGRMPAVGAILVTNESWWGHVAYVEAVNGDQVTVSEMNYAGFGVTSRRTISNSSPVIKGYIY